MKKINIVFDGNFDDVDVLMVPDHVADNIKQITQTFFNWLTQTENQQLFIKAITTDNGTIECLCIGTQEFVWWLNQFVTAKDETVHVLFQHTSYRPEYPTADF